MLLSVWVDPSAEHIFVPFESVVHKSIILVFPPTICIARTIAMALRVYRAIYDPPHDPPFVCHTPYSIGNGNIVVETTLVSRVCGVGGGAVA